MSWFSLFTEKQKLKHKISMLEDTVRNNMIADMDYKLKEYAYKKAILKKNIECVVSAIVVGTIICLYFNFC